MSSGNVSFDRVSSIRENQGNFFLLESQGILLSVRESQGILLWLRWPRFQPWFKCRESQESHTEKSGNCFRAGFWEPWQLTKCLTCTSTMDPRRFDPQWRIEHDASDMLSTLMSQCTRRSTIFLFAPPMNNLFLAVSHITSQHGAGRVGPQWAGVVLRLTYPQCSTYISLTPQLF